MKARAAWKGVLAVGATRVPARLLATDERDPRPGRALRTSSEARVSVRSARDLAGRDFDSMEGQLAAQAYAGLHLFVEEAECVDRAPGSAPAMDVSAAVAAQLIDPCWFVRRYRLAPDGDELAFAELARALGEAGLHGIAAWTMRGRAHRGCLIARASELELATLHLRPERALLHACRRLRRRLVYGAPARRFVELAAATPANP